MKMMKLAMAIALTFGFASSANAAMIFTIKQVGQNVVADASGTFDATGLVGTNSFADPTQIYSSVGNLSIGPRGSTKQYGITTATGSFGSNDFSKPGSSSSGIAIGFQFAQKYFFVRSSYVNNTQFVSNSTFYNTDFLELGLIDDTYEFGVGSNIATVIIGTGIKAVSNPNIPGINPISAVPEASTWLMMMVGFGLIGATARYRRRGAKVTYA